LHGLPKNLGLHQQADLVELHGEAIVPEQGFLIRQRLQRYAEVVFLAGEIEQAQGLEWSCEVV
jgi:hypothetical protein